MTDNYSPCGCEYSECWLCYPNPEDHEDEKTWVSQVFGDPNSDNWEISVVKSDNKHGRRSWGWFDENKLLVSHSGGPCRQFLAPGLGPVMIKIAEDLAKKLSEESS